jgi:hypothetical protein
MISDEEGLEWAKLRGHTTLEAYNELASEYRDMKERHQLLVIYLKDFRKNLGVVINEYE